MDRILDVLIVGNADELKHALSDAESSSSSFGSHFAGIGHVVEAAAAVMMTGLTSLAGAAADSIHTLEESSESTAKFAAMTGMSTKQSAAWVEIAKVHGIELKQLGMGFKTLSTQVLGANEGTASSVKLFDQLGVSQSVLKSGNLNQIIAATADGFNRLGPGVNRTAIASKLFGREYQFAMQIMDGGSKSLNQQMGLANQFANALGVGGVNAANKAIEAQRNMEISLDTLKVMFAEKIMPIVMKAILIFTEWLNSLRGGVTQVGAYITATVDGHTELAAVLEKVYTIIKGYVTTFLQIFKEIGPTVLTIVGAISSPLLKLVELFSENKTALEILVGVITAAYVATKIYNGVMAACAVYDKLVADAATLKRVAIQLGIVSTEEATTVEYGFTTAQRELVAAATDAQVAIEQESLAAGEATVVFEGMSLAMMAIPLIGIIAGLVLLVTHWHTVVNAIKEGIDIIETAFKDMALGMVSPFISSWGAIRDAFRDAMNWIIGKWDSLKFTLPHIDLGPLGTIGGGTVGVPQIPYMAYGGRIPPGGQWVMTGERGPEPVFLPGSSVVMSNREMRQGPFGGGEGFNINVHNTGSPINELALAREMAFRMAS